MVKRAKPYLSGPYRAAVILHVCIQAGSAGKAGWGWDGGGDGGVGLRGGAGASVGDLRLRQGRRGQARPRRPPPRGSSLVVVDRVNNNKCCSGLNNEHNAAGEGVSKCTA